MLYAKTCLHVNEAAVPLKILVSREAGFCMGVKRALELAVGRAASAPGEVLTWGPLIHNPQVVELLRTHGVDSARGYSDLGPGKTVFISAHGISPAERERIKETGVRLCDASCPDVVKVQAVIRRHAAAGYATVIFGDAGHTEVRGLLGFAGGLGYVVDSEAELEKLPELEKVLLVSQTTRPRDEYERVAVAARERFSDLVVARTICASTLRRQEELAEILKRAEALVVVGGANSANTARLTALARARLIPAYQVETAEELPLEELENYRAVGVTAGASTPNWLIQGVVERLKERAHEKSPAPVRQFFRLGRILVKINALVALGAASLSLFTMALIGAPLNVPALAFAFFATQSIYILNVFADQKALMINAPHRYSLYRRRRGMLLALASGEGVLALAVAASLGLPSVLLAGLVFAAGSFYIFPLIPGRPHRRRFKDSAHLRELLPSLGWVAVTVLFPLVTAEKISSPGAVFLAVFFVLVISLVRSILFGLRDLQGDRLLGRGTIPVLLGRGRTKILIVALLGLLLIFTTLYLAATGWGGYPALAVYPVAAYILTYFFLFRRRIVFEGLFWEVLVDCQFLLGPLGAGLVRLGMAAYGKGPAG